MYVIQDIRKYTAKVRTSTDISFVLITTNTSFYSYKLFLDYLILLTFFGTFRSFETDTTVSLYNISCLWKLNVTTTPDTYSVFSLVISFPVCCVVKLKQSSSQGFHSDLLKSTFCIVTIAEFHSSTLCKVTDYCDIQYSVQLHISFI